jgi:hypothetical protein
MFPTLTKLIQKLHPGEPYYLTNIRATNLNPRSVRDWSDDLWLFPYYTDKAFAPFDARPGGPASAAYPRVAVTPPSSPRSVAETAAPKATSMGCGLVVGAMLIGISTWSFLRCTFREIVHVMRPG